MSHRPTRSAAAAFVPLLVLSGCVTQDDGRVQQLLNQRGFGTRFEGDTNRQYYVGIGDTVSIVDALHPEFNATLRVRSDGVIDPEHLDEVYVAGLTIPDLEETLTRRYREFNTSAQISVQLQASASKWYYVDGMVTGGGRGRVPFAGDLTLFAAVFLASPDPILSDTDAVRLIRADPYHPLVVVFDYDDMLGGGWALGNIEVRENDIIYVPPNLFGHLTKFTQMLFSPLTVIVASVFDVNRLLFSIDTFGDTDRFRGGRFGRIGAAPRPAGPDLALALAPLDLQFGGE